MDPLPISAARFASRDLLVRAAGALPASLPGVQRIEPVNGSSTAGAVAGNFVSRLCCVA